MNKKLHLLAVSIAFSGFALADDYASPAAFVPVIGYEEESPGSPMSCTEARETAWFIRELARSDGDTNPDVEYVPCGREILAEAGADFD